MHLSLFSNSSSYTYSVMSAGIRHSPATPLLPGCYYRHRHRHRRSLGPWTLPISKSFPFEDVVLTWSLNTACQRRRSGPIQSLVPSCLTSNGGDSPLGRAESPWASRLPRFSYFLESIQRADSNMGQENVGCGRRRQLSVSASLYQGSYGCQCLDALRLPAHSILYRLSFH